MRRRKITHTASLEQSWRFLPHWHWLLVVVSCSWRSLSWMLFLFIMSWLAGVWLWIWSACALLVVAASLPIPVPCMEGWRVVDFVLDWGLWPVVAISPVQDLYAWTGRIRRIRGNLLVRRLKLVDEEDQHDYRVWWYARALTLLVDEGLGVGLAPEGLAHRARDASPLLDCVDATVSKMDGVHCVVCFHRKPRYMALAVPRTTNRLPSPVVEGTDLSVPVGRSPEGTYLLDLRNLPGLCVGGASRSGKTRAVLLLVASLSDAGLSDVTVIDCKGGSDFTRPVGADLSSLEGLGAKVLCDRGDSVFLDSVQDLLDKEVADMRERQEALPRSYWEMPGNGRPKLRVLVVDECQELWAMKGRTKEETERLKAIQRNILTLIRVGASAGWCTILCSQDWTSDVIDTSVRSQLLRIAFWSAETSKTKAILGIGDETLKTMNFDGLDRADWRGLSIIVGQGRSEWVRWDCLL